MRTTFFPAIILNLLCACSKEKEEVISYPTLREEEPRKICNSIDFDISKQNLNDNLNFLITTKDKISHVGSQQSN